MPRVPIFIIFTKTLISRFSEINMIVSDCDKCAGHKTALTMFELRYEILITSIIQRNINFNGFQIQWEKFFYIPVMY